ncbi:ribonuclease J [Clostridia bacterium]|nr:ribonuclease J [Clostridia bacterium]
MSKNENKVSIIPLGGLGEIGKNMTVIKYGEEMILIDAGLTFPEDDMLGIDIVIPDITYLEENRDKLLGIFLTHAHEDHIGALPYVLDKIQVPVYGTRFTLGLVKGKLKERRMLEQAKLHTVKPRGMVKKGPFKIEFFRVSHSIPDAVGIVVHTPEGIIVHTGDFKFDQTPVDGQLMDLPKLAKLGEQGVLALMSDSTNAERSGSTMSEKEVGRNLLEAFREATGRVIVASFASNVHRVQQIVNAAAATDRKVAVIGRSMVNIFEVARELGYLRVPKKTYVEVEQVAKLPPNKVTIITTGSQGEPKSALSRLALSDHRQLEINEKDTVIISANPIPGNEKYVSRTIDQLFRLGAKVIYGKASDMHVSGHASKEDLLLMLNLIKPKYFIPVHGEYRMQVAHAKFAEQTGVDPNNIFIADNGQVIELSKEKGRIAGRVSSGRTLVDGLGVGDVGNIVLRDRKQLSEDGIVIVMIGLSKKGSELMSGPDVVSRGFVYVRESEELMDETKKRIVETLDNLKKDGVYEWSGIKNKVREQVSRFLYEKTRRRPMVLPIIVEI